MSTKKFIITFALSIFVLSAIIPQTNASNEQNMGIFDSIRIYNFNTTLDLSNKDELPTEPLNINNTKEIELNLDFNYEYPQYFPKFLIDTKIGKWILFRNTSQNMSVDLKLTITEQPEWCIVNLTQENIEIPLSTEKQIANPKINFKIKAGTKAFLEEEITIKAEFIPKENWGLEPSQDQLNFSIISEFQKSLDINYSDIENKTLQAKPGENLSCIVKIKNNGNGDTLVNFSLDDTDLKGWNISFKPASAVLKVDQDIKEFKINISVPAKEENYEKSLNFTISSKSATEKEFKDNYLLIGSEPFTIDIRVEKEEENEYLSNLLIILGIFIVILLIVAFIIKIFKKKE